MAFPLAIALALGAAQDPRPVTEPAPLILVSGCRRPDGSLAPHAFELGDGGIGKEPLPAGRRAPGEAYTPGGIRIRAQAEGIKLDFVSGAELLITPSARLCLRDGEQTLPALGRLALAFADGSRLEIEPESDPRRPLRRATLIEGSTRSVLWPAGQAMVWEAGHRRAPNESTDALLVLGDGRAIYRVARLGPILGLRAVLRPRGDARFAAARFVIVGDVLVSSLQRLPAHVPRKPVQFPQAPEAVARLAELAPLLFGGKTVERAARARGPLVLELADGWRLHVELGAASGQLTLGLYRDDAVVPAVEWLVTKPRTVLQLVRPSGGEGGGPRYFLRGIDLGAELDALWPGKPGLQEMRWAHDELLRLGARALRDRQLVGPYVTEPSVDSGR